MKGYEDNDIIPFGKHVGKKMCNIPADYLMYLYNQPGCDKKVWIYVDENKDVLEKELSNAQKEKHKERQKEYYRR